MPRRPIVFRPKLRVIVAVAALAATVPVVQAGAESIPGVTCSVKGTGTAKDNWQSFKSPTFLQPQGLGEPSQDIAAYAVAPNNPRLVAVTNGNSIQVSRNGGCTWEQGLRLDQVPADANVPLSGQFTKIRGLYIAPRSNRIFATAEELDSGATVGRPHLIYSDTGRAASWTMGDEGLPAVGAPLLLRAHPDSPNIMYFTFANAKDPEGLPCPPAPLTCNPTSGSTPGLLWGSSNGGQTWSRRTDPSDLNGASAIKYFSVDDNDASGQTLWVVANGLLRQSTNGGTSFTTPDGLNQTGFVFTAVETIDQPTKLPNPIDIIAFSTNSEMIRRERGKWIRSKVPFNTVESISQRPEGDIAVATAPTGGGVTVWRIYGYQFKDYEIGDADNPLRFKLTFGWQSITPRGVSVSPRLSSATAGGISTFFMRDRTRILRFLGTNLDTFVPEAPPELIGSPPPPLGRITPPNVTVNLAMGKTKVVDYTLTLPPAPTPIDLYLLIDNSGSMQPLIDELKRSLGDVAVSLVRSGVDVRIGVGQINVQPDKQELPLDDPNTPNVDESKPRPVYQRLRAIGPVDGGLFRALSTIDGYGGSGDEAQLEALWQSVTGDGYSQLGAIGPLVGYNVPRGQDAGWRDDADVVKVIVHATDEEFSENIQNGHNDAATVAKALNNAGVRQIGLSQGVPQATEDLALMARLTGALAPPGGTDCDGDGRSDIKAGGALVCEQNYGLDKTLVNLIKSLSDLQTIQLQVSRGATVRKVSRMDFPINAKTATKVKFQVTYGCIGVAPGVYTHDLRAGLRGIAIAKAVATVNCGAVPIPPENPPNVPNPQPPPVNPQPVPAPIAPVQPIPQPQTQVQGQPQVNPQAGAAEQKQRQIQVALAENDIGIQDEDQLAMVGLGHENDPVPGVAVVLAGMAMASACATALAFRRRAQVAVASIR